MLLAAIILLALGLGGCWSEDSSAGAAEDLLRRLDRGTLGSEVVDRTTAHALDRVAPASGESTGRAAPWLVAWLAKREAVNGLRSDELIRIYQSVVDVRLETPTWMSTDDYISYQIVIGSQAAGEARPWLRVRIRRVDVDGRRAPRWNPFRSRTALLPLNVAGSTIAIQHRTICKVRSGNSTLTATVELEFYRDEASARQEQSPFHRETRTLRTEVSNGAG